MKLRAVLDVTDYDLIKRDTLGFIPMLSNHSSLYALDPDQLQNIKHKRDYIDEDILPGQVVIATRTKEV
jgi:hypothetical protein